MSPRRRPKSRSFPIGGNGKFLSQMSDMSIKYKIKLFSFYIVHSYIITLKIESTRFEIAMLQNNETFAMYKAGTRSYYIVVHKYVLTYTIEQVARLERIYASCVWLCALH